MLAMTRRLTTGEVLSDFASSPGRRFPGKWMSRFKGCITRGRFVIACDPGPARLDDVKYGCTSFVVDLKEGVILLEVSSISLASHGGASCLQLGGFQERGVHECMTFLNDTHVVSATLVEGLLQIRMYALLDLKDGGCAPCRVLHAPFEFTGMNFCFQTALVGFACGERRDRSGLFGEDGRVTWADHTTFNIPLHFCDVNERTVPRDLDTVTLCISWEAMERALADTGGSTVDVDWESWARDSRDVYFVNGTLDTRPRRVVQQVLEETGSGSYTESMCGFSFEDPDNRRIRYQRERSSEHSNRRMSMFEVSDFQPSKRREEFVSQARRVGAEVVTERWETHIYYDYPDLGHPHWTWLDLALEIRLPVSQ